MYTNQMWTATTRLHLYLLEKGLDQTMGKLDEVEADKEMIVGDVQLDHNGRDPNLGMTSEKDLSLETMIRKTRQ